MSICRSFPSVSDPAVLQALPSPVDEATYRRCKLDLNERQTHARAYALHRDLLALRRAHATIAAPSRVDGSVLDSHVMALRLFGAREHILLLVNLGPDLELTPAPEPLLAPPGPGGWSVLWSSESIEYGGQGPPRCTRSPSGAFPERRTVVVDGLNGERR